MKQWPVCPHCQHALVFVLQFYSSEYKEFFSTSKSNFFQLFRCPNKDCFGAFSLHAEAYYLWRYEKYEGDNTASTPSPKIQPQGSDYAILPCEFRKVIEADYPDFVDLPEDLDEMREEIEEKYPECHKLWEFRGKFAPREGTKIGGYPSWQQSPDYPTCPCGQTKVFLLQISTYEESKFRNYYEFAPVCSMGDDCNVFFFACPECSEDSMETRWDTT